MLAVDPVIVLVALMFPSKNMLAKPRYQVKFKRIMPASLMTLHASNDALFYTTTSAVFASIYSMKSVQQYDTGVACLAVRTDPLPSQHGLLRAADGCSTHQFFRQFSLKSPKGVYM